MENICTVQEYYGIITFYYIHAYYMINTFIFLTQLQAVIIYITRLKEL